MNRSIPVRVNLLIENAILQGNVYGRALDSNHFLNILDIENGRSSRSDLQVKAYHIFKIVVKEEAIRILHEDHLGVIGFSTAKLWKMTPPAVKSTYQACAEAVDMNIPKRNFVTSANVTAV
ncbi:10502_t:CDS:1, partial [Acaulospora colombiana]